MKLILLLLSLQGCVVQGKKEMILIIVLPQNSTDSEVPVTWQRAEEILPGALAAIEEANNYSVSFEFTLIKVNTGSYELSYSGNVLEVIADLVWEEKVSHIIGIAGVLHPNVLAVIDRFQLPIASLVHSNESPNNSNVHYLTASTSTLIESVLAFLTEISPKKIGLITEIEQPYYLMVSSGINAKISISLNEIVQSHHKKSYSGIANKIFANNIHVILLNVGPSTALSVLCEAYKNGLTWPKYAWILHSYRLDDLLRSSVQSNPGCNVQKILEGIFIFQLTGEETNFSSYYSAHHIVNNGDPGFNPYADLLYHSVWALISSVDNRSFSYSNSVSSQVHCNPGCSKIYIYHNINNMGTLVGTYNGISHTLANVSKINFRDSDLAVVSREYLTPFLPLPLLCFLFNTILLILYIYFRNEPSVKSTSVSLSMLIFTGCYITILFSVCLTINRHYTVDFCMLLCWLSGTGLSVPLILATVLVKMLRVYHIFTTFKILKNSALLSDCALLLYCILILSPNIVVLTLWTAIDPYRKVILFFEHPGFTRMEMSCHSNNTFGWFGLGCIYIFLLALATVIVAIKSRNIRRTHFKDTRKVNLNIFLTVNVGLSSLCYYLILLILRFTFASFVVIYFCHIFLAFLSQFTLFVPKIWPIIQAKLFKTS